MSDEALRNLNQGLAAVEEHLANTSASLHALVAANEAVVGKIDGYTKAVQTLAHQVSDLTQRLNQYLDSAAEADGRIRQRLTALEARRG